MATLKRKNQPEVKTEPLNKQKGVVLRKSSKSKKTVKESSTDTIKLKSAPKPKRTSKVKNDSFTNNSNATKRRVSKSIPTAADAIVAETVFVPSSASLRLLEKLEIYRLWYETKLPTQAAHFAKVAGYTFILLGALFASAGYLNVGSIPNTAALVCAPEGECGQVDDSLLPEDVPVVTFLNTAPEVLTSDLDIVIRGENSVVPTVYIEGIHSGKKYTLSPIEVLNENERKYLIALQNIEAGSYQIKASVETAGTTYIFTGSQFRVDGAVVATKTVTPPKEELITNTSTSTAASTTTETSGETEVDVEALIYDLSEEGDTDESPLLAVVETLGDATYLKVSTGNFAPSSVYVYSEPDFTTEPVYLGQATLVQGSWIFSLSAMDMQRFAHKLYASFTVEGRNYQTPATLYTPLPPVTPQISNQNDLALMVEKVDVALNTAELNVSVRDSYFSYISSTTNNYFATNNETSFATPSEIEAADRLLNLATADIDFALYRYAAVVQGANRYLQNLASLSQRALYQDYLQSGPQVSPTLETLLSLRFQNLRDRVKEEEERIMAETNELTTRDTDRDGVGDFDEVSTFDTDPNRTDTDRDGVLDGVEVATLSNPAVVDVTGLPSYTNPAADLVVPEVLEIKVVEGLRSEVNGTDSVYAVVRGKTVPHAMVWLLFPSLGVKGFVKAGNEGGFAYTLEQEIPDGEHTVLAVLPDASGKVAVGTKVSTFTKAGNHLVATASLGASPLSGMTFSSAGQNSITVAAIALIAFGLILLLLSIFVRGRGKYSHKFA